MKTLIMVLSLLGAVAAIANNSVTLNSGRVLKNIWLLAVGKDTITIWHDGKEEVIRHSLLSAPDMLKLQPKIAEVLDLEKQYRDGVAVRKRAGGKIATRSGKFYEGVKLEEVEADHILIQHEGGVARISLDDLPDDIRLSFKTDIDAAKMAEAATKKSDEKQMGIAEWSLAQRVRGAMGPYQLTGLVVEQNPVGTLVVRTTPRPDYVPGVYALVEGVKGKKVASTFTGKVTRAGVWTDSNGKTYPKYVIAR